MITRREANAGILASVTAAAPGARRGRTGQSHHLAATA